MQSSILSVWNTGEIVAHKATNIVGQIVETIHPSDDSSNEIAQVLQLPDGTRHSFRAEELRPANGIETRRFVQAVME